MGLFRNLNLLTKIILLIAIILIAFFAVSSMISYRQQRAFILEESVDKDRIIASEAVHAREYISQQLQVGNIPLSEQRYGMIPVVASNRIGQRVGEDLDYRIRQVSNRYRNPKNAPDTFESKVLERFVLEPSRREEYGITELDGKPVFRYLQAFTADQSCLECHSDPAVAPDFIKAIFPPETDQAYNYRIGEVIGAASVTIPMDKLERQILANVRNDILFIGGIFLVLITCLALLTRLAVTRPLGLLGEAIGEIVRTGRFEEKLPRRGRDEIGQLIDGFNVMIDHLGEKTRHLEESEKRFRVLTETARDGIISFLANGQIILFNRQAERIFGYSKREALGLSVDRLIHEDCTSLAGLGTEAYLKKNAARLMQELNRVPGRRRDGTRLSLELSLSTAESEDHLFYTVIIREHR